MKAKGIGKEVKCYASLIKKKMEVNALAAHFKKTLLKISLTTKQTSRTCLWLALTLIMSFMIQWKA